MLKRMKYGGVIPKRENQKSSPRNVKVKTWEEIHIHREKRKDKAMLPDYCRPGRRSVGW